MQINVNIKTIYPTGKCKARLTANLDGQFAIRGLRLMDGRNGFYVEMPAFKGDSGAYVDHCFPCTAEFRAAFTAAAVEAYYAALEGIRSSDMVATPGAESNESEEM